MKVCPKCLAGHDKAGVYCSRSCANSRTWSDEDRQRKSEANMGNPSQLKGKRVGSNPKRNAAISEALLAKSYRNYVDGKLTERSVLRRHISEERGYVCSECGISEWNGKPITLQVDHVDGNPGNNQPVNLRLVCPNCHSQTSTFGSKNKGFGRKARGLKMR